MTYKERAEMMNLRQRVEAQREEIKRLQQTVDELKKGSGNEEVNEDGN